MNSRRPLDLVRVWHLHQPDYRDHASGEFEGIADAAPNDERQLAEPVSRGQGEPKGGGSMRRAEYDNETETAV
jgi:hypothetical protein